MSEKQLCQGYPDLVLQLLIIGYTSTYTMKQETG